MDKTIQQVFSNLTDHHDFSPEYVTQHEKFALAVIREYQATQASQRAESMKPTPTGDPKRIAANGSFGYGLSFGTNVDSLSVREEHYLSIKLKQLQSGDADFVRGQFGSALVNCIVIESGTPEFEQVQALLGGVSS